MLTLEFERSVKVLFNRFSDFSGRQTSRLPRKLVAHGERLSQKIVSTGPGLDTVEGVTRRSTRSYCYIGTLLAGSSHTCLRQPQELPEHILLGHPRGIRHAQEHNNNFNESVTVLFSAANRLWKGFGN